jgi:hypothetical protein
MTNGEASQNLAQLIQSIDESIQRLQDLREDPGGPIEELVQRKTAIDVQIMALTTQRQHAVNRKAIIDVAAAGDATAPIDPARAAALTAALTAVSNAIAHMNEFQQAVQLAAAAANAITQV